ncbi:MAG: peptide chain release factor N(5)-glutamine methyltransferase [Rhodospirillales bacterium]|nr:peptide chain release factor N(5)-glutamine methyltransferase [Rhodospirillales bacterium]
MTSPPTLGGLVDQAARRLKSAGIDGARLDARLIVGHAARLEPAALLARSAEMAGADVVDHVEEMVKRRENRQPMAQILGQREFWSLPFRVTRDTLIPRPDSETLIIAALDWAERAERKERALRVLDLGTGTGCLLLSLLSEWPAATGIGVDVDPAVIEVAGQNARDLELSDRARFVCTDWGDGLDEFFDVVISNPPYVPEGDLDGLEPDVVDFEPRLALCGGADGLDAYRALSARIGRFLAPGGAVFLEIGFGQASGVADIMTVSGFGIFARRRDLGGVVRCLAMARHAPVDC